MLFGKHEIDLGTPRVMGILNLTPDSFSDGGQLHTDKALDHEQVLRRAEAMVKAGVDFLDVGGESTRPGAKPVSVQEEMDRVLPAVEKLNREFDTVISVDTSTPEVMRESYRLGAGLINDVRALGREGAVEAAAETGLPVCIMHMQGSPATMQNAPSYEDVILDIDHFFTQRIQVLNDAGIESNNILLDPGFGFGKTLEHNLRLLNNLTAFSHFNMPLLIGTSRKTMIGQVLNKEVDQRLYGSLATVACAIYQGAEIIRVHDVPETIDVVRMCHAIRIEKGV